MSVRRVENQKYKIVQANRWTSNEVSENDPELNRSTRMTWAIARILKKWAEIVLQHFFCFHVICCWWILFSVNEVSFPQIKKPVFQCYFAFPFEMSIRWQFRYSHSEWYKIISMYLQWICFDGGVIWTLFVNR